MPGLHYPQNLFGEIVCVLGGKDDSDAAKVDSDCISSVSVAGLQGVLFVLAYGPVADGVANTYAIVYATDGAASNCAASGTGWTCTDCTLVANTDVSTAGGVVMGYLDIAAKGFSERGVLSATRAATEAVTSCLIAIPVAGNMRLPASNNASNVTAWTA